MIRQIDVEALKKDIAENSIMLDGTLAIEVDCVNALIDLASTDVKENLTTEIVGNSDRLAGPLGEWIIIDDTEKFIAKCSVCGRIEDSRMVKYHPYCRCGAYMQKEAKND